RFSFDTPDAPAEYAQTILHSGVRVGTHAGVWVRLEHAVHLASKRESCKVLNVHLVHNSRARGHNLKVVKSSLTPAEELVPLTVALVLNLYVLLEGLRRAVHV